MQVKGLFFDRAAVMRAAGAAGVRALSKAGSFIWKRARTSMPYRKRGSAPPGKPPFAHPQHGARLRKLLFYSYDPSSKSVVVGPIPLANKSTIGATVPNLHEFGGRVVRRVRGFKTKGGGRKASPAQAAAYRAGLTARTIDPPPARQVVTYSASYAPRPFMGPALRTEVDAGRVAKAWAGAVKGAA